MPVVRCSVTGAYATAEKICIIDDTSIYIFNTVALLLTFQTCARPVHKAEHPRPPAERHSAACLPPPQTETAPCVSLGLILFQQEIHFRLGPRIAICAYVCVSGSQHVALVLNLF